MQPNVHNTDFFKAWLTDRTALAKARDRLRADLRKLVLPVVNNWIIERIGPDPLTGQPVFAGSHQTDTTPTELMWRITVRAFDGRELSFESAVFKAALVVSGSEQYSGEYLGIISTPDEVLLQTLDSGVVLVLDILNAFARTVLI